MKVLWAWRCSGGGLTVSLSTTPRAAADHLLRTPVAPDAPGFHAAGGDPSLQRLGPGSPFLHVPQPGAHELPLSLRASGPSLDPPGRALAGRAVSLPGLWHLARCRPPLWELRGVRSVSVLLVGCGRPDLGLWSCRWFVFDLPSSRQCSVCVLRTLSQGCFHSLH